MSTLTESNTGNRKKEILEKSRRARKDEGLEFAELRGHQLAAIGAFIIAGAPLIIYSILFGRTIIALVITAFIEAYYACLHVVAYRLTKKNKYIFYAIMCVVCFIFCAFIFVRIEMGLSLLPGFGAV